MQNPTALPSRSVRDHQSLQSACACRPRKKNGQSRRCTENRRATPNDTASQRSRASAAIFCQDNRNSCVKRDTHTMRRRPPLFPALLPFAAAGLVVGVRSIRHALHGSAPHVAAVPDFADPVPDFAELQLGGDSYYPKICVWRTAPAKSLK